MKEERPDGVFRFMGGQLNCAATKSVRDKKIADVHQIIDQWDVQGGGFSELGINWQRLTHTRGFSAWFRSHPQMIFSHQPHTTQMRTSAPCISKAGLHYLLARN
jgi:hypothetical protein